MRYGIVFVEQILNCCFYSTVSRAPAQDKEFAFCRPVIKFLFGYIFSDLIDLLLTDLHHQLVIFRIVTYIACDIFFFQAADAVFQTNSTGHCPWSNQFFITEIGLQFFLPIIQFSFELNVYRRQLI